MKEIDRAAAVSQQLRMWEWLFTRPRTVMDTDDEPVFYLDRLVDVSIEVRPPEGAWKKAPENFRDRDEETDTDVADDQIPLFDEVDDAA